MLNKWWLAIYFVSSSVLAAPFAGLDMSGIYDCKGNDFHEGNYSGIVTMKRIPAHSSGSYAAYSFQLEVPGFGVYHGQAVGKGRVLGVHFALEDQTTSDYGTGIAHFHKNKAHKWTFTKYYYEPAFKGGNHGIETCVMR